MKKPQTIHWLLLILDCDKMLVKHELNKLIVRKYDIRGIFEKDLNPIDAYFVGLGLSTFIKNNQQNKSNKIVLSCDGRLSSPVLKLSTLCGILDAGFEAIDTDLVPTPVNYFTHYTKESDAAIMITGSHNPKNYNGFKITVGKRSFFDEKLLSLAQLINNGIDINSENYYSKIFKDGKLLLSNEDILNLVKDSGKIENYDVADDYIDNIDNLLFSNLKPKKNLRIFWDCGNGATGDVISKLTTIIPAEQMLMYTQIDGNFPNHHPDPSKADNLKDLIKAVKENEFDVGFAFDGDGDRVGLIDNFGRVVSNDQIIMLISEYLLKKHPKSTIIVDVKISSKVVKFIENLGGKCIICPTGHSYIKEKIYETKAIFAGEASGHFFYCDNYFPFDDAIFMASVIIKMLLTGDKRISDITGKLPKLFINPEIQLEVKEEDKLSVISELKEALKNKSELKNGLARILEIDGVRAEYKNGWWLVRPSNTQNAIIIRYEGDSKESLNQIKEILNQALAEVKIVNLQV